MVEDGGEKKDDGQKVETFISVPRLSSSANL